MARFARHRLPALSAVFGVWLGLAGESHALPRTILAQRSESSEMRRTDFRRVADAPLEVPTASLALGFAGSIAFTTHALYRDLARRRQNRVQPACQNCTEPPRDQVERARRTAEISLAIAGMATAAAVWLVYHDPRELMGRLRGKPPVKRPSRGISIKVRPKPGGVWATLATQF